MIGEGKVLNWDIGFCIGAVHFRRGYAGGMRVVFRVPNTNIRQTDFRNTARKESE